MRKQTWSLGSSWKSKALIAGILTITVRFVYRVVLSRVGFTDELISEHLRYKLPEIATVPFTQTSDIIVNNEDSHNVLFLTGNGGLARKKLELIFKSFCTRVETIQCVWLDELIQNNMFFSSDVQRVEKAINKTVYRFNTFGRTVASLSRKPKLFLYSSPSLDFPNMDLSRSSARFKKMSQYETRSILHPDLLLLWKTLEEKTIFKPKFIIGTLPVEQAIDYYFQAWQTISSSYRYTVPLFKAFDIGTKFMFTQLLLLPRESFSIFDLTQFNNGSTHHEIFESNDLNLMLKEDLYKSIVAQNSISSSAESFVQRYNLEFLVENTEKTRTIFIELLSKLDPIQHLKSLHQSSQTSKYNTDDNKFVFFAGIEGTGHHLWSSVIKSIIMPDASQAQRNTSDAMSKIDVNCDLNNLFFQPKKGCWESYSKYKNEPSGLFCSIDNTEFSSALDTLQVDLKSFAKIENNKTFILNLIGSAYLKVWNERPEKKTNKLHGCGSIASYPAFAGVDKASNKPDLLTLARAFSDAKIKFEPVLLVREIEAVTVSDVWHRRFNVNRPALYEIRVLLINLSSLLAEAISIIPLLGEESFKCLQYENSNEEMTDSLDGLLGEDILNFLIQSRLPKNEAQASRKNASRKDLARHGYYIDFMKQLADVLQSLCRKK